ncbi:phosphotransferase [Gordonia sp. ABSL1-1]|uniref:phosphotransferase n=1 Tax=Gordonia sp. ABSL1-1 TaxID=3053923 RepID=UPI0025729550|nr:phosphotransferase [Gordonia sp. ABSL1-1]MDL9938946.1 phosphotransferase [Gordonia sp. ABSL1-1]
MTTEVPPTLPLPTDLADITPEWMTRALSAHHAGAVVDTVAITERDDGTNRRARLALTYATGTGPASVFVKGVDEAHKDLLRITSGLLHEPRLFASGVDLPVEHPTVFATQIDAESEDFVLVMEDLTERGADPRDATRPLTVEQAASGVRGLAQLHGAFWGERCSTPELDWLEPFHPWNGMEIAPLPAAYERMPEDTPPAVTSLGIDELLEKIWKPYIRTLTTTSQTLLHGDPHIGNTYLIGDQLGFLDWQVARRGNFSLDLGYFLQGALTVEDRRRAEWDLLGEYRDALGLPAGECPSAEEIELGYRASVAHGLTLWLCTASAGELWQRPDIAVALAERYAFAFDDLDTAEAIARLEH